MTYLSPKEAAEKLGVNKRTVLKMIKAGTLPALKLTSRTFRIDENDLKPNNQPCTEE